MLLTSCSLHGYTDALLRKENPGRKILLLSLFFSSKGRKIWSLNFMDGRESQLGKVL
jgi:hypothetical protein